VLLVSCAVIGVPIMAAWIALRTTSAAIKAAGFLISVGLIFPASLFSFFGFVEGFHVLSDGNSSDVLLAEVRHENATFRLYQTNCGATCAYGLVLNKEFSGFGPVKLVSPIWFADREDVAELRLNSNGMIEVARGNYVLFAHKD
jgi:hypothetical protein